MNQIQSLLLERGHIVEQGRAKLAVTLAELLDGKERVLAARIHELIADMRGIMELAHVGLLQPLLPSLGFLVAPRNAR